MGSIYRKRRNKSNNYVFKKRKKSAKRKKSMKRKKSSKRRKIKEKKNQRGGAQEGGVKQYHHKVRYTIPQGTNNGDSFKITYLINTSDSWRREQERRGDEAPESITIELTIICDINYPNETLIESEVLKLEGVYLNEVSSDSPDSIDAISVVKVASRFQTPPRGGSLDRGWQETP